MNQDKRRMLVLGLIATGLIIIVLYGFRTFLAYREVRGHRPQPEALLEEQPRETDVELIRDWMTIPYIARMYHVPPPELYKALGISPGGNQDKNLEQLNKEHFRQESGLAESKIKASILEYQAKHYPDKDAVTLPAPIQTTGPTPP